MMFITCHEIRNGKHGDICIFYIKWEDPGFGSTSGQTKQRKIYIVTKHAVLIYVDKVWLALSHDNVSARTVVLVI